MIAVPPNVDPEAPRRASGGDSDAADAREDGIDLRAALARLPAEQRSLLALRHLVEGRGVGEIAGILGIPEGRKPPSRGCSRRAGRSSGRSTMGCGMADARGPAVLERRATWGAFTSMVPAKAPTTILDAVRTGNRQDASRGRLRWAHADRGADPVGITAVVAVAMVGVPWLVRSAPSAGRGTGWTLGRRHLDLRGRRLPLAALRSELDRHRTAAGFGGDRRSRSWARCPSRRHAARVSVDINCVHEQALEPGDDQRRRRNAGLPRRLDPRPG